MKKGSLKKNFFPVMRPLRLNYPGCQEPIASYRFSKFDREHAFSSIFQFWSMCSPIGAKIEISSKKHVPGRISKNGLMQWIPESLNSSSEGALFEKKKTKTFLRSQMVDFRCPVDYPIRKIKIFIQRFAKVYLVRSIPKFNAPNCMVGELFMLCT